MAGKQVRVRFAPSPTGGLHMGGMRTVLYNYLFARKHQGRFILRIEDTDQQRYVPGAEEYIYECLKWTGLQPDESPLHGGDYGPYRQSERKEMYRQYAEKLVEEGYAYYAFDTAEELEVMREKMKTPDNPSPQYDFRVRLQMKNSLTLPEEQVQEKLNSGVPYVIRLKMPENETVKFHDLIRGDSLFQTALLDDKVLLKADGMPTYHLAVVVDDYLMKITHVFRGEEWLPSAPAHVLLWRYLFGEENMPQWAHLPLILGPEGKLSKRDGMKYGFPVYPLEWKDPATGEIIPGFREFGFMPQAFVNFLALLGWNDGTDKEIFTLEELIETFSIERVHSAGARFDFEKAKWFNHTWIKLSPSATLLPEVNQTFKRNGITISDIQMLEKAIDLVKERCHLLSDFMQQAGFFFQYPENPDLTAVQARWNEEKKSFFENLMQLWQETETWNAAELENRFKTKAESLHIKTGELLLPLRIMLVGGKFGPPVFDIAELLGKAETLKRIQNLLDRLK
ncbi:MAG: glutamate--tRNA ligase [Chitinophagaceae bacterium]|nr:glutamate--tRNA ligase [Chitinophagaceae bacterium]